MKTIRLVISGSGTKLPVFAGALKRLEEAGITISEVVGTSGGSIIAAAIASGYNADRIIALCKEIMPKLGSMVNYSLLNAITNMGFVKGDKIHAEFEKHFIKTLGEAKIPLHVVTTNFDLELEEVFSTQTHPKQETAIAIAASMAIPVVFEPVAINGDWHVDGGVFANFAIDYFGNHDDVLGLYFMDPGGRRKPRPKGLKALVLFIGRIIDMFILAKTRDDISEVPAAKKIALNTSIDSLQFDLTEQQIDMMIKEGYDQTSAWLKSSGVI